MDPTRAAGAPQPAAPGASLRVSLGCPKCGVTGWVKWASLSHAIHCPKCKCEFMIARDGHLHSLRDLPQVRFTCPRCGKSGSLPSTSIIRKAECADCKLPLVAGPDQRLHGVREAAQMQRESAGNAQKLSYRDWLLSNVRTDNGRIRVVRTMLLVAPCIVAVCAAAAVIASLFDNSPETLARHFTRACLADEGAAASYLQDDPVQAAELDRFRLRNFASILDKYRPKSDRATVDARLVRQGAEDRVLEVRVTSTLLGTRRHEQIWHQQDGQWRFDARATLAVQDAVAARPSAQLPPGNKAP